MVDREDGLHGYKAGCFETKLLEALSITVVRDGNLVLHLICTNWFYSDWAS